MHGLALVLRPLGDRVVVLPRRLEASLAPGPAPLVVEGPPMDEACAASLRHAWAAARALAGRPEAAARFRIPGEAPLVGGSAGLLAAVLGFAMLRGASAPPRCFATGEVADEAGRLAGGAWAREKAEAAASLAADLEWRDAVFLSPALPDGDAPIGIEVVRVATVREACRVLESRGFL